MDDLLKQLADAGLAVGAAEEAVEAGEHGAAREAIDRADEALADLRSRWPQMQAPERDLVGRTAGPLRARLDAVRRQVTPLRAVSQGAPEVDPEQDVEPEAPPPAA